MKRKRLGQKSCCCGSTSVSSKVSLEKVLVIDFLYLDLTTCERCQGTDSNLDESIQEVSQVLQTAGFKIKLNKINVITKELAIQHEFVSSPTIRINDRDIAMDVKESNCTDCGDLCGDEVDCRVWEYEGIEYTQPPKALIVNAILKAVYGGVAAVNERPPYQLPENLRKFYQGTHCC